MNTSWTLTVLGASSTLAPSGDSNACLHLTNEDRSLLIDAGGNLPQLMNDLDLDFRSITDVIITHSHPDHNYGLPFLSHAFYESHRSINCWSTEDAIPRLEQSLEAYELQEPDRYLDIDFHPVSVDDTSTIDLEKYVDLQIETFPTRHSRPGFGLTLSTPDQHLVYSGDTAPLKYLTSYDRTIDYLLHDCQATDGYKRYFEGGHTSAADLGKLGQTLDVGLLVPFHHNLTEFPPSRHEIATEIREYYEGPLVFPTRGMSFFL